MQPEIVVKITWLPSVRVHNRGCPSEKKPARRCTCKVEVKVV